MAGSAWTNQVQNQVIVGGPGGGVFVYFPTPGPGNLIASITDAQRDIFGNPTQPVITSYGTGANAGDNVIMFGPGLSFTSAAGSSTDIRASANLVTVGSSGVPPSTWQFNLPVEALDALAVTGGLTADTLILPGEAAPAAVSGSAELYLSLIHI